MCCVNLVCNVSSHDKLIITFILNISWTGLENCTDIAIIWIVVMFEHFSPMLYIVL